MTVEWSWPAHWPRHDSPHDTQACQRCQVENLWVENHLDCACVDHPWDREDVGTPAVPELVWCCSSCCRVQGPAFAGDVG